MTTSRRQFLYYILLSALLFTPFGKAAANSKGKFLVYIGTYTDKNSRGIYAYRFDASTGELTPLGLAAASTNPSFLVVSRDRKFLYAVDEVPNYHGPNSGAIRA